MRFLPYACLMLLLLPSLIASARNRKNEWLNIYGNFRQWQQWHIDSVDSVSFNQEVMTVYPKNQDPVKWSFWNTTRVAVQPRLPLITITTDTLVTEIPDKENYLSATFEVEFFGDTTNISSPVNIRGRGNSTWYQDKKPYRLKFDKKISLFGLPKAKSWCLLANVFDATLMQNTIAAKAAELIGLYYPWHTIPVDVILNGNYRGSYILTEKTGINSGSIDINEETSVLWEMDTNFDEELQFMSPKLNLPVMLKDPAMDSITFLNRKQDFLEMEDAIVKGQPWEKIDKQSFIKYLIINSLALNHEITYPRSVLLWKERPDDKYHFCPVWDFDWAFGKHFPDMMGQRHGYDGELLPGNCWIDLIVAASPDFIDDMRTEWDIFYAKHFPQLLDYLEKYHQALEPSQAWDNQLWFQTFDFDGAYNQLIDWLKQRAEHIDTNPYLGLY